MSGNKEIVRKDITQIALKMDIPVLGFVKAGHFFSQKNPRFEQALNKNYLSSFVKSENEIQKNFIRENYKTILSVLIPYMNPMYADLGLPDKESEGRVWGKISSSSWGLDYHLVLYQLLDNLAEKLTIVAGSHQYQIFVDNAPFSERMTAVIAGVGRIGRNSTLIHPGLGSFFFIGELLTTLDLADQEPVLLNEDPCKDCFICVRACPVNAIDGHLRMVDAAKCLSQQTQEKEKKDALVISKIKETGYLFGCDICQMVCPHNHKKVHSHKAFLPVASEVWLNAEELLCLSNREFKNKYGHLAASWRGKKPLAENARILLT